VTLPFQDTLMALAAFESSAAPDAARVIPASALMGPILRAFRPPSGYRQSFDGANRLVLSAIPYDGTLYTFNLMQALLLQIAGPFGGTPQYVVQGAGTSFNPWTTADLANFAIRSFRAAWADTLPTAPQQFPKLAYPPGLDGPPQPPPGTPIAGNDATVPGAIPWIIYRRELQNWLIISTVAPTDPGPLVCDPAALASALPTSTSPSIVTCNTNHLLGDPLVTVTTSTSPGSYIRGSAITVNGLDDNGNAVSQTLRLTAGGGGETLTTSTPFSRVTTIAVAGQADTAGAFTFGVVSTAIAAANAFLAGLP
jgi:hypothetical protein